MHLLAIPFIRVLAHLAFKHSFDINTPARIASLYHGLICTFYVLSQQWKDAISSTLIFFLIDIAFEFIYKRPKTVEMIAHHVIGIILCAYSLYSSSFENHRGKHLTRALIALEICNPILHTVILMTKEKQLHRISITVRNVLRILLILQFLIIRILVLLICIILTAKLKADIWVFLATLLWILQVVWFYKLIKFNPY